VYNSGASILSIAGTVTLDGQGDPTSVWIFQAQSSMVIASASRVAFINGAQPCNVFWQVTSSATLGSTADLAGTIMALDSVTMANGVTLNGRALARNGTVTLINDNINRTTCATVSTTPVPTFGPTPGPATPTPVATAAPSAAPTTAATATPIGRTPAAATPAVRSLPSTATAEDDSFFVVLALVGIIFVILYMVARARRRARNVSA
jgi:hypothetical protein